MNIQEALNIIEKTATTSKIDNFTFWIQFGQAIEVIKQYVKDNENKKELSELSNLPKMKTEDNVTFTLMTAPSRIVNNLDTIEQTIERCKELVEKPKTKFIPTSKPIVKHYGMVDAYKCPECGSPLKSLQSFCTKCETKLDWHGYTPPEVQIGYKGTKTIK